MKKTVVPMVGETVKKPLFGSGKISRRCTISKIEKKKSRSERLHENLFKRASKVPYKQPKKTKLKQLKFPTSASKIIFGYWNNLGHPFVRHKPVKSKVTSRGISRIESAMKKHGKESVVNAIATAEKVFNAGWFKWRLIIGVQKIALPDFFLYSNNSYNAYSKKIKDLPRSWFEECMKGSLYMEKKYSVIKKDKHPHITGKLLDIWRDYKRSELSSNDVEQLKKISFLMYTFCESNNFDWMAIVDIVDGMLNKWHTFKPRHLGQLIQDRFWKDILRREIVRYGIVSERFKWNQN